MGDFFMKTINKILILVFSIMFYFILIEVSFYLHLSKINLNYLAYHLNVYYSKNRLLNTLFLFIYFCLFFFILDFIYSHLFIKKYSILAYLIVSLMLNICLYFIIYLKQGYYLKLNIESIISFYSIISFTTIFNLYSLYYSNFIEEKKALNKQLPEPISFKFD